MNKPTRDDTLMVLASVPEVKEKAGNFGLTAMYDPEKNTVVVYDLDVPIGSSTNGQVFRPWNSTENFNFEKWLKLYAQTQRLLQKFTKLRGII